MCMLVKRIIDHRIEKQVLWLRLAEASRPDRPIHPKWQETAPIGFAPSVGMPFGNCRGGIG